jgi:hypothetical protein
MEYQLVRSSSRFCDICSEVSTVFTPTKLNLREYLNLFAIEKLFIKENSYADAGIRVRLEQFGGQPDDLF